MTTTPLRRSTLDDESALKSAWRRTRDALEASLRGLGELRERPPAFLDWLRFAWRTQLALVIALPTLWFFGATIVSAGFDVVEPAPGSWHESLSGIFSGEHARRVEKREMALRVTWAVAIGGLSILSLFELPSALSRARRRRTRAGEPMPGTLIGDRYRLIDRIGDGGAGVVYAARDLTLDRRVALKALTLGSEDPGTLDEERAELIARFREEAHALARISHPGIVQIFDLVDEGGDFWIAMELMEGGDLSTLLRRDGPLPPDAALEIIVPLADALDCIHSMGIVHRDIKPLNVLLSTDGTPKLADFGLAKSAQSSVVTRADVVMGSPAYMSPEQVEGGEIGPASDVYALGALLYELLTGQPPFSGEPANVLVQHVIAEPPPPSRLAPSTISQGVDDLVLSMLAKHPDDRPKSLTGAIKQLAD